MGLVMYPSQPASKAFSSSPSIAKAVRASTTVSRVAGSEWEICARDLPVDGQSLDDGWLVPLAHRIGGGLAGGAWTWTQSDYAPYPGYRPTAGALGEYNGKFMCNQMVLRGGSCATPRSHIRATYRNFFPPDARWQFSGIRLARDLA